MTLSIREAERLLTLERCLSSGIYVGTKDGAQRKVNEAIRNAVLILSDTRQEIEGWQYNGKPTKPKSEAESKSRADLGRKHSKWSEAEDKRVRKIIEEGVGSYREKAKVVHKNIPGRTFHSCYMRIIHIRDIIEEEKELQEYAASELKPSQKEMTRRLRPHDPQTMKQLEKENAQMAKWKIKDSEHVKPGKCVFCGKPSVPKEDYCELHEDDWHKAIKEKQ